MSIVKMRKMVRKQLKIRLFGRTIELGSPMAIIFWIIVIIFFVGTYYMYGGGGSGGGPQRGGKRDVTPVVAEMLPLFPFPEDERELIQRRIKAGIDRVYEELGGD